MFEKRKESPGSKERSPQSDEENSLDRYQRNLGLSPSRDQLIGFHKQSLNVQTLLHVEESLATICLVSLL